MKRLFNLLIGFVLGTMFIAGTAFAFNATEHVTVTPNGKGDAGIFPVYIALDGGWETKIEVINTSLTQCVVAKVVVRTARYSQEVLDFFIFLSPADVWTGYLNYGPLGARMYSTDDSVKAGTRATGPKTNFASVADPMNVELYDDPCDGNEMGYVEVIEGWNFVVGATVPVLKPALYAAWLTQTAGIGTLNSLAMHYEINLGPFQSAERATVLRDYDVTENLTLGAETFLGSSPGSTSRNSICEVEAVLGKYEIAMPYYAGLTEKAAFHFLTFPTKYTSLSSTCGINTVKSPYFLQNANQTTFCIDYGFYFWDLEENSINPPGSYSPVPASRTYTFCNELNMVNVRDVQDMDFDEGWIQYDFADTTSCAPYSSVTDRVGFTGAPVIPTTLLINLKLGEFGMALVNGAWTDGVVDYNAVLQPYYHYGPYPYVAP